LSQQSSTDNEEDSRILNFVIGTCPTRANDSDYRPEDDISEENEENNEMEEENEE